MYGERHVVFADPPNNNNNNIPLRLGAHFVLNMHKVCTVVLHKPYGMVSPYHVSSLMSQVVVMY